MTVHNRPGGTTSIRQHLVDEHGVEPGWAECASDAAVCGRHDGKHGVTWAESVDLPHPSVSAFTAALTEGFCPECLEALIPHTNLGYCPACHCYWSQGTC